ncbi:hypothetical protein [Algoriphagus sp.]|uniref:hypothetical protein n=1 Tax=Algoriphagus sp. TaxID=1872435 RepID=UPI003919E0BB
MTVRKKSESIPEETLGRNKELQELRLAIQEGIDSGVGKRTISEIAKGVEGRLKSELIKGENT